MLAAEGFRLVGWRDVPVDHDVVGKFSKETQPIIVQAIMESTAENEDEDLERQLYIARKLIEKKVCAVSKDQTGAYESPSDNVGHANDHCSKIQKAGAEHISGFSA